MSTMALKIEIFSLQQFFKTYYTIFFFYHFIELSTLELDDEMNLYRLIS